MTKLGAWVNAARLRTLPLSVSGILVGTSLGSFYGEKNIYIFILALLTTIGFQITSNFANDYGDGVKGTDNDDRIGPKRALQSGILSSKELKRGIYVSIVINLLLVIALIFTAFGFGQWRLLVLFFVLGILSIWAAIKYTVGNSAYGYSGLGDLFVFVFFGLVSVMGSMFLYIKEIPINSVLPATAIGLLSVGVLNLNNLRDHNSDKIAKKNTVVVKIGFQNGKIYHYCLLIFSFLALIAFMFTTNSASVRFIVLIAFLPIIIHMKKVYGVINPRELDPELKKLALSTFLLALLFFSSYYKFL